jgi:hypothetical protein
MVQISSGVPPRCGTDRTSDQQTGMSYRLRWSTEYLVSFCMKRFSLLGQCPQPRTVRVDWSRSFEGLKLLGKRKLRKNLTHTKRVNEEIVLNFVYIPVTGSAPWNKAELCGTIQEIHLPTMQTAVTKSFQYPMCSVGGFSEGINNTNGGSNTCPQHRNLVVALSICCML